MSEENAQHPYIQSRVLIDGARVITSVFPQIGIVLNGKELEILRNLMNYAARRNTFVGAYHDNYYLSVDDDDWLDIETTTAILEEKLMGNDNVIWGYYERWYQTITLTNVAAGTHILNFELVPEGYVYVLHAMTQRCDGTDVTQLKETMAGANSFLLDRAVAAPMNIWHPLRPIELVLQRDDKARMSFYGCSTGDDLYAKVWGYKMKVPA
jgi:hypothetical protein